MTPPYPPCPITGRPAKRYIQGFARGLLVKLWKFAGAGDVSHLFPVGQRINMYESDCGLYFFDPMIAGDDAFYQHFYQAHRAHEVLNKDVTQRAEYVAAARHVPAGAHLLDVGCGGAGFASHVPHCQYRGLDPYAAATPGIDVVREALPEHRATAQGQYDVVTAFQVIEHVPTPREFTQQLVDLLRPGGTLILCVPLRTSVMTEIPNFVLNAPPHHLAWWNASALAALASTLGLHTVALTEVPVSSHEGIIYWMHKFSFVRTQQQPEALYYAHRWLWHLNSVVSYALAQLAHRFLPVPNGARAYNVMLVAQKPLD